MEREAGIAPTARPIREEPRAPFFTTGNVLRLLVFGALAAFLLYYVGPRDIAETALKVALAVALTAAALGRRQPPVRPGVRPLDPLQHHHRCRASASSATSSPSRTARSRRSSTSRCDPSAQGVFDDITGWVHAAVRRQLAALGADRRRRPRVGDVPAQRPAPAARPAPPGRGRLHRLRSAHRLRPRRVGVSGARLGQAR